LSNRVAPANTRDLIAQTLAQQAISNPNMRFTEEGYPYEQR